jgi:uncharacterized protein YecT (DUF1311 family)
MRKLRLVRLAAVALLAGLGVTTASSVQAQTRKPTAQETRTVRDCFEKKGGTTEEAECVGLVATPCTESPDHQANLHQADCFRIEGAIWDAILNETFKALKDDLDDKQERKLREMQRAWIASRDRTCGFFHVKIDGSMAVPMSASCLFKETARRALLLKTFTGL